MSAEVIQLPRRPEVRDVRCECVECGTHVTGWQGHTLSAWCDNCGSYDVRVVASAAIPFVTRSVA